MTHAHQETTLMSLLREVLHKQDRLERKVDRLLTMNSDALALSVIELQLGRLIELVGTPPVPAVATRAVLVFTQGETMPGAINVDTLNETVTLEFVDDKGDVATGPDGVVVVFNSDNSAVVTVTNDAISPLQGDVTVVGEGTANLSATLANADGSPVLEADGVTPFPTPAPVAVTVSAGPAVGDSLVLSV